MIKFYKYLPLFLQNVALTLKNNYTYYLKYDCIPFFRSLAKVVRETDKKPTTFNDKQVSSRIKLLINYAVNNTIYYGCSEDYCLISSSDVVNLNSYPLLGKVTLRTKTDEFISKQRNRFNSYTYRTSGTSGASLSGYISKKELKSRFDVVLQSYKHNDIDDSSKVARFSGAEIGSQRNLYRTDYINKHYFFSIYHISQKTIFKYVNNLNTLSINVLEGYPSTLYALAVLMDSNNLSCVNVQNVITTAEKLFEYQKEKIEKVFKVKVFDYYGSSEGSSFVFLCKNGKYHNSNLVSELEVLDDRNNPVQSGEGKMVVTSFTSKFTPLIRYDIGDRCVVSKIQSCDCGVGGMVLDEIIGRSDDVFHSPNGNTFSRFSLCLKYLPKPVIQSKLILKQQSYDVKLLLETMNHEVLDQQEFKDFESKFISMMGPGFNFEYQFTEKIDFGKNGKLKVVRIDEN